jgi:hypothetical protein
MWGGRAPLRGRARTPTRRGTRTSAGGTHPCGEGAHACGGQACLYGGAHACEEGGAHGLPLSFGSSAVHFQIKLSIHASNFNSRFVSMSELELFLLTGVFNSKLQHYGPFQILEKNQKLHIQIVAVTLKVTSCRTMSKKKK